MLLARIERSIGLLVLGAGDAGAAVPSVYHGDHDRHLMVMEELPGDRQTGSLALWILWPSTSGASWAAWCRRAVHQPDSRQRQAYEMPRVIMRGASLHGTRPAEIREGSKEGRKEGRDEGSDCSRAVCQ